MTTLQGEHFYEVMAHTSEDGEEIGHFIVHPTETEILQNYGDSRLTLTACHPKRSSRLRIVVTARLVSEPQPTLPELRQPAAPEDSTELVTDDGADEFAIDSDETVGVDENALESSLGWNLSERRPTILWGLAAFAVAIAAVLLARKVTPWLAYSLATPPFVVLTFMCFVHLDRLLPAL